MKGLLEFSATKISKFGNYETWLDHKSTLFFVVDVNGGERVSLKLNGKTVTYKLQEDADRKALSMKRAWAAENRRSR